MSFALVLSFIAYAIFVLGMLASALCDPEQDATRTGGQSDKPEAPAKQRLGKTMSDYERRIVYLTALIASVTCGYALVAAFQWRAMIVSNNTTRQALVSVQRAFVFPDVAGPIEVMFDPGPKGKLTPLDFFLHWKNSGTTPARHCLLDVNSKNTEQLLPDDFAFSDSSDVPKAITIPPMTVVTGGEIQLTPDTVMWYMANPSRILYIWGWVKYRDVFPGSPPHLTEYCVYSSDIPPTPDPKSGQLPIKFKMCKIHDCSDDDCPDYRAKIADYK